MSCRLIGSNAPADAHKGECKAKIYKKVSRVKVSIMGHESAKQQRLMETEKYKLLTRLRNGAETVMSVLRRACHVDTMPVRGLLRGRLFFGFKIGAQRADIALAMEDCCIAQRKLQAAWLNCKKLFA